jgi:hypothetical protein
MLYSLDPVCESTTTSAVDDGDAADDDGDAAAAAAAAAGDACNRTARVVWQLEFPLAVGRSSWSDVMTSDIYNNCGGSAYKLPSGNFFVAFTSMSAALTEFNTSRPRTALAWEASFMVTSAPPTIEWNRSE